MIHLESGTIGCRTLYKVLSPREKRWAEIYDNAPEAASALRAHPNNRLIVSLWSTKESHYYGSIEITEITRLLIDGEGE